MSRKKVEICDAADYLQLPSYIVEDLEKSGLNTKTQKAMRLFPIETDYQLEEILGRKDYPAGSGKRILEYTKAYGITYPDGYIRVKLLTPIVDNAGHTVKYLSPSIEKNAETAHIYYLIESEKLAKKTVPLFIVEGEKKTAKVQQELDTKGLCLGIPGVTMWKKCLENKKIALKLSGRKCYIAFDYSDIAGSDDKAPNVDVQRECFKLWLYLRRKKIAHVYILTWDDDLDCKGIDDYLVKHQKEDDLQLLLDNASENPFEVLPILQATSGYARFAEYLAGSFCSKEEYKALWQEFELGRHYGLTFDAFNDLAVRELKKVLPEKEEELPFDQVIQTIPGENRHINYIVSDKGIFKAVACSTKTSDKVEYTRICADAVRLTEQLVDIFGSETTLAKLQWGKREAVVPSTCLSGPKMALLAEKGIRVQTPNGKDMSEYFLACLNATNNSSAGEPTEYACRNGWINGNFTDFVFGNKILSPEGERTITYSGTNLSIGEHGDQTKWSLLLQNYAKNPLAQIVLGAAAISPLLKPLSVEPQIVHLYGDSSSGKSFFARLAASFWGKARGEGEIIAGWDASRVGPEQYFSLMNHLPSFLDDSQEAPTDDYVKKISQAYINCHGKTRGGIQGGAVILAQTPTWHGFLISTGEKKITDSSNYSGLSARTLEFHKTRTQQISQLEFLEINESLQENYGFGAEIIRHFFKNRQWYKDSLRAFARWIEKIIPADLPAGKDRALNAWAAIFLGAKVCQDIWGFDYDEQGMARILLSLLGQTISSKGSQGAYEYLLELYASNRNQFGQMVATNTRTLSDGTQQAVYKYNGMKNADCEGPHAIKDELGIFHPGINAICFYPQKLKAILSEAGYTISQVSDILSKDRIVVSKGQFNQYALHISGVKINFYAIRLPDKDPDDNNLLLQVEGIL